MNAGVMAGPAGDRELKLDPAPESVGKARKFVRERLLELGYPGSVDDAVLIVSELATNAITAAPDTPFLVAVRVDPGSHPVIEVHDSSPDPPVLLEPDLRSEGGRGLPVVDALCAARDLLRSGPGKAVIVRLRH